MFCEGTATLESTVEVYIWQMGKMGLKGNAPGIMTQKQVLPKMVSLVQNHPSTSLMLIPYAHFAVCLKTEHRSDKIYIRRTHAYKNEGPNLRR